MLKGIPSLLSPDLLKILMEMGHGDEIVLADGNFPSASHGQRLVRLDGHGNVEILKAMLKLFPLDTYVEHPAMVMQVIPGDTVVPVIWEDFKVQLSANGCNSVEEIERGAFYERAKRAYCVIATGETALYANLILRKGVVVE